MGEGNYWDLGYNDYLQIAKSVLAGHGFCLSVARFSAQNACAAEPPLYPLLVSAALVLSKTGYPLLVFLEAALGTATVVCAYLIGRQIFGERTGLLAAALTAFYPYYVWHDVRLEETSLFTFLVAASTALLLGVPLQRLWWGVAAGTCLGLAALTRFTILPYAVAAVIWIGIRTPGERRLTKMAAVAFPVLLLVGGWVVRNNRILGYPTVSSESGRYLWSGNNLDTFSRYPIHAMEESENVAWDRLSPDDSLLIEDLSPEQRNRWFESKAVEYIRADPLTTARSALRKIGIGFSPLLSPRSPFLSQAVYAASYGPILVLAAAGASERRREWRKQMLLYLAFLGFAVTTAIFWAHTKDRVYLDVYLLIFASATVVKYYDRFRQPPTSIVEVKPFVPE